ELYVSSTPHETRLALTEDGTVAEVYFEREKEYSLAGAIYKGRVTRVLPGMQSAFVDVGLERDAFLYVSDFFEDSEEYDRVVSEAENAVARAETGPEAAVPPAVPASEPERPRRDRGRRGERGRFSIPEEKFARPDAASPVPASEAPLPEPGDAFTLPGESLAKYRHAPAPAAPAPIAPAGTADDAMAGALAVEAPAFVLPGESLAKYRNAPDDMAELEPPTAEQQRQEFEHDRIQPDAIDDARASDASPAEADAEASVRAEAGEARMQAPGRRDAGRGRGRRRRRGGRDRRPQGDAPRPAEAGAEA